MRREAYRSTELQRDVEGWFTATFTDPNTKETFSSGLVGKQTTAEMRSSARLHQPLHQAETTVFDGKVYYKNKQLAENAAAARAIDCYIFREEGGDKSDLQLCMEDPYRSFEEGKSQAIDYDALLGEKRLLVPTFPFTSFANAKPHLFHVPKLFLQNAFVKAHGSRLTRQAYDVQELQRNDEESWFTATFTDPTTKETFSSGLVGKEADAEKRKDASLYPPLHQVEATVIDGKVFYRRAKLAENAAAARAIDCSIFREGGGEKSELQLCMEDPYQSGESQTIDYDALLAQRNEQSASQNHSVIMSDRAEVGSAMESTVHEVPALELSFVDNPPATASPLSTMGRIAEIWIDAASGSESTAARTFAEHKNADQSLKGILNWYDELDKEPRGELDASGLAQLCNKILAALGKAVITQDLEETAHHVDVEGDAKVILDHILSLSSTFDDTNDPSFFDADTFNAYIQCLNPLDPARSAKAATDLLNSMSNQEKFEDGVVLPLPNVGTYNSAMALWALVDGAEGQKGVNDVFSLLESASLGIDDDRRILPNKETFNLLLAVNSKVDGRFSFEQAKLWLGKMQGISESILGEAFVPDADVYTAALTTFSKSTETNPTTEQYGDTWLRHGHPYVSGFKTIDDCASEHAEATGVAEWLIYAEQSGVTPSIDMYEAVIRAWVKTGALREGLLTAETWATRAVQSGSPIRLQTFHPIIAAWAMCQLDRAPDRVAEWTKQLASHTALEPDLTTLSAQIIAWRNVQAGLMEKAEVNREQWSEDYEMQQDIERVFALAQNCTQYLKEVFADGSVEMKGQQDADALSSMFANAIETWGSASRFTLRHPSNSVLLNARHGVNEMLKIARLFDATIDDDDSEEKAQYLLRVMGDSVSEVLSQLHQIDSAIDDEESDHQRCYFLDRIGPVEAMTRNYEFYSQKHFSPSANFTSESKAVRHRMYGEALKGCAGVKSPSDFGHVARICRMIMDNLAWQNEHCPGGGKADADITDLYVGMARLMQTVVQVPEERMYALTKLHKSAMQFFEKKRKSEGSSYATVDRARLIGAMRMAMDDAALTEEFIQRFDGGPKTNARGNTALAVVDRLLS
ncbi:hypothetical protein ACHAXT_002184 [Thalassiosira profunda]